MPTFLLNSCPHLLADNCSDLNSELQRVLTGLENVVCCRKKSSCSLSVAEVDRHIEQLTTASERCDLAIKVGPPTPLPLCDSQIIWGKWSDSFHLKCCFSQISIRGWVFLKRPFQSWATREKLEPCTFLLVESYPRKSFDQYSRSLSLLQKWPLPWKLWD